MMTQKTPIFLSQQTFHIHDISSSKLTNVESPYFSKEQINKKDSVNDKGQELESDLEEAIVIL